MSPRSFLRTSLVLLAASGPLLAQASGPQARGELARVFQRGSGVSAPAAAERGYLGVYMEVTNGAMVVNSTIPGGPAAKAGLEEGDRVVKIGGHAIRDMESLQDYLGAREAGERLSIELERNGWQRKLEVTLAGRSEIWTEGSGFEPPPAAQGSGKSKADKADKADKEKMAKAKAKQKAKAKADQGDGGDQGWSRIRKAQPSEGWVQGDLFERLEEEHDHGDGHDADGHHSDGHDGEHEQHTVDVKSWFEMGEDGPQTQVKVFVNGKEVDPGSVDGVWTDGGKAFQVELDGDLEGLGDRIRARVRDRMGEDGVRWQRRGGGSDGDHAPLFPRGAGGGGDVASLRAEIESLRAEVTELREAMREVQQLSSDVRKLIKQLER